MASSEGLNAGDSAESHAGAGHHVGRQSKLASSALSPYKVATAITTSSNANYLPEVQPLN